MIYKVEFSKNSLKQLKKMDNYTKLMILNWIEKNLIDCDNPYLHGKSLKGNFENLWRYRVGDYRIITEIHENKLIILVLAIGHRREIYK